MGVRDDITAPYSAVESFLYDRLIAPAVLELGETITEQLADRVPGSARLLDVGCGGGHIVLAIAERRPAAQVTGLDLSTEQVARAEQRARRARVGTRVRFVQGSALDLPFPDGSFDVVMSVASIKHWPDQKRGLREATRVLAPGGELFVFEADRGCRLSDAQRFVAGWRLPRALRPFALAAFRTWVAGQALDLDDARELLAGLPLTQIRVERVPGTPALVMGGQRAR